MLIARSLHVIVTYRCLHECDVCHLFAGPDREGTFTRTELDRVLSEAKCLPRACKIVLTGGEPFLYYPLLFQGVRQAHAFGFDVAVTTTGDWARDEATAVTWLAPLRTAGLQELRIAEQPADRSSERIERAARAARVAREMGFAVSKGSHVIGPEQAARASGSEPSVVSSYPLRGRGASRMGWAGPVAPGAYASCPLFETPDGPRDLWIEPGGAVLVCHGVTIGSLWWSTLGEIVTGFRAEHHPVLSPLARGGPAELAETFGMNPDVPAGDGCQLCTRTRLGLRERFPEDLGPGATYGNRDGRHR